MADPHYAARQTCYGRGMIPAEAMIDDIGTTRTTTPLFPRDGGYLLTRQTRGAAYGEGVGAGDRVTVELAVTPR